MSGFPRLPDPPVSYSQRDQAEFRRALTGYLSGVEGFASTTPAGTAYTKAEADALLAAKATLATTLAGYGITDAYTKAEADALLAAKAAIATTLAGYGITDAYTKTAADALLAAKAAIATTLAGYGITDAYTKTATDALLANKADTETVVYVEAVRATSNQSLPAGSGTNLIFNSETSDASNAYDNTTGLFVAPVAGKYLVSVGLSILFASGGKTCQLIVNKNGDPLAQAALPSYVDTQSIGGMAVVFDLAANDNVNLKVNVPGGGPVTPELQAGASIRLVISRLFNA